MPRFLSIIPLPWMKVSFFLTKAFSISSGSHYSHFLKDCTLVHLLCLLHHPSCLLPGSLPLANNCYPMIPHSIHHQLLPISLILFLAILPHVHAASTSYSSMTIQFTLLLLFPLLLATYFMISMWYPSLLSNL